MLAAHLMVSMALLGTTVTDGAGRDPDVVVDAATPDAALAYAARVLHDALSLDEDERGEARERGEVFSLVLDWAPRSDDPTQPIHAAVLTPPWKDRDPVTLAVPVPEEGADDAAHLTLSLLADDVRAVMREVTIARDLDVASVLIEGDHREEARALLARASRLAPADLRVQDLLALLDRI